LAQSAKTWAGTRYNTKNFFFDSALMAFSGLWGWPEEYPPAAMASSFPA
jgi:hypothetical protein